MCVSAQFSSVWVFSIHYSIEDVFWPICICAQGDSKTVVLVNFSHFCMGK